MVKVRFEHHVTKELGPNLVPFIYVRQIHNELFVCPDDNTPNEMRIAVFIDTDGKSVVIR